MSGSETYLGVLFVKGTSLEDMRNTLTSAGLAIVDEKSAGFNLMIVSIPTDLPEEVESRKGEILALSQVEGAEIVGGKDIPERRMVYGAGNPETFPRRTV